MASSTDAALRTSAAQLCSELRNGRVTPGRFSAALEVIPPPARDEWLDALWDLDEISADAPDLPRGCVPYLPCAVAPVLEAVQQAVVTSDDVFVDVGAGVGRAAFLVHQKTGAACIGLEIQSALVRAAQSRADSLHLDGLQFIVGDAADTVASIASGTVFFLYCPFSGARLRRFLDALENVRRARPIRVCCVDMPPLECSWLVPISSAS